jgi:hypothetical protein
MYFCGLPRALSPDHIRGPLCRKSRDSKGRRRPKRLSQRSQFSRPAWTNQNARFFNPRLRTLVTSPKPALNLVQNGGMAECSIFVAGVQLALADIAADVWSYAVLFKVEKGPENTE